MAKYKPYFDVKINKKYTSSQRKAIGQEIVDQVVKRSLSGTDKNGAKFKPYSKEYKKSLDFKLAGKSSKPNLRLSFSMLNSVKLRSHKKGMIRVGIDSGDTENKKKAEGNELGTYGQKTGSYKKARKFLGITSDEKKKILGKYKLKDGSALKAAVAAALERQKAAREIVEDITLER